MFHGEVIENEVRNRVKYQSPSKIIEIFQDVFLLILFTIVVRSTQHTPTSCSERRYMRIG